MAATSPGTERPAGRPKSLGNGDQVEDSPLLAIFLTWGPVLLIVALWLYFMRKFARQQSSSTGE